MSATKLSAASISPQERDLALLRGLFESRLITAAQAATLYFEGKGEAAKKRLQKLKAAGLVGERKRQAFEPSVLFLTRNGLTLLRDHGVLTEYPHFDLPWLEKRSNVSELTLRHELEVMDVKAAFYSAIKNYSAIKKTDTFSIAEFSTWPLLYQFEAMRPGHHGADVTVKPDGFIRIHEKEAGDGLSEHTFFLEVDRSTETLDTLVMRAGCYFNYYKSGDFAVRNGADRLAFKKFPFRVLFVFKTAERRNNMAERMLQNNPPIFAHVCLATFAETTTDPLGAIWMRPIDYREATKGTPYSTEQRPPTLGYQRQTARELFVGDKVKRCRILENDPRV